MADIRYIITRRIEELGVSRYRLAKTLMEKGHGYTVLFKFLSGETNCNSRFLGDLLDLITALESQKRVPGPPPIEKSIDRPADPVYHGPQEHERSDDQ